MTWVESASKFNNELLATVISPVVLLIEKHLHTLVTEDCTSELLRGLGPHRRRDQLRSPQRCFPQC